MMGEALLRLGHGRRARDYLRWFAPYQFDSGKVPCCVDARGADPVPENDSHGEFIFLVAEVLSLHARPRAARAQLWPHVRGARCATWTSCASASARRQPTPERRAFYGLMPPSISHEGYSDKPAYSYWDDFWALLGYKDAVQHRRGAGRTRRRPTLCAAARDEFARDLLRLASRPRVARHGIDYIAGAADRGDFDATSTTIALAPGGEQAALPRRAAARHLRALLARVRRAPRRQARTGRTTRPTSCASSAPSCASASASARTSCCDFFFERPAPARLEPVGRGGAARRRASRASSATCRTPGCTRTTSARRSTCSPTSATATPRWCSPPACPPLARRRRRDRRRARHAVRPHRLPPPRRRPHPHPRRSTPAPCRPAGWCCPGPTRRTGAPARRG